MTIAFLSVYPDTVCCFPAYFHGDNKDSCDGYEHKERANGRSDVQVVHSVQLLVTHFRHGAVEQVSVFRIDSGTVGVGGVGEAK